MKKAGWVIGGVFLCALFCLIIFQLVGNYRAGGQEVTFGSQTPLARLTYDGLTEIEILQINPGFIEDGIHPGKRSWQHGRTASDGIDLTVRGKSNYWGNSAPTSCYVKFQDRANSSLFLAVRYKEKGRITRTSDYRFSFGKVVGPERTGKNLAASKEAPSILMKDGAGPLPPFLIQLSDGHGGWLSGDGPLYTAGLEEAEKLGLDYHIIRFPAWPRDRANLEFRAILPQSPEQRFTLPNPKPAGKPSLTSAITPLPHHEVTADFELEIAPSKRTPFPELGTLIEIPTRLTPAASLGPNANWFFSLSRQLTDQWENNLTYHNHNYSPRSSLAGWLTASHSGPYQLICQVTRGPGYPRPEAECTIYAEGQIGADGKTPIIQKLYRSTGVTNASAEAKSPFFQEIGGQGLALDLSFEWDSAKAAKRATISNYSRDNLYLFLDGSPSSTGICQQRGGSSGGGHFGKIRASVLSRWSGNLSAHQTFKIGSAPSLPPQEFRFIIDGSAP